MPWMRTACARNVANNTKSGNCKEPTLSPLNSNLDNNHHAQPVAALRLLLSLMAAFLRKQSHEYSPTAARMDTDFSLQKKRKAKRRHLQLETKPRRCAVIRQVITHPHSRYRRLLRRTRSSLDLVTNAPHYFDILVTPDRASWRTSSPREAS